nr:hypothetical protein [Tanacetum cinerariifolium]
MKAHENGKARESGKRRESWLKRAKAGRTCESRQNDQSSGKKIVREIVLSVKAGDEKVVKVDQKKPHKLGTFKTAEDAAMVYNAKKEEFQVRKMGMNLAVASGSGHDPIRKDESGRVWVGNVSDGMKVVGSGGPGGSYHVPTWGAVNVSKIEEGGASKACEVKKVASGLKRV